MHAESHLTMFSGSSRVLFARQHREQGGLTLSGTGSVRSGRCTTERGEGKGTQIISNPAPISDSLRAEQRSHGQLSEGRRGEGEQGIDTEFEGLTYGLSGEGERVETGVKFGGGAS